MVSTRQQCSGAANNGNNGSADAGSTSNSENHHNGGANTSGATASTYSASDSHNSGGLSTSTGTTRTTRSLVPRTSKTSAVAQIHSINAKSHTRGEPSASASSVVTSTVTLVDLPTEILDKIISYFPYSEISTLRLVSKRMDVICGARLNSTFYKLQNAMLDRFQVIKSQMPRRESARRAHPLACESDIIETLHMRLALLQMTFGKHIERRHCCFFAGEVLDEVFRILHYIKITPKLARPYKVTDELFDLTSMAMEYFKEKLEPHLPEIAYFGTDIMEYTPLSLSERNVNVNQSSVSVSVRTATVESRRSQQQTSSSDDEKPESPYPPQSNMVLRKRIRKIKQGMRRYYHKDTFTMAHRLFNTG